LPELDLHIDCNEALATAESTATESGIGHVLNLKIVDAWDVKSEGDTWYASACSAKIMFNDGEHATLKYQEIPLHGKYFLQARIVP
jgi:hypothetical protein